jgi:hypothetical protein
MQSHLACARTERLAVEARRKEQQLKLEAVEKLRQVSPVHGAHSVHSAQRTVLGAGHAVAIVQLGAAWGCLCVMARFNRCRGSPFAFGLPHFNRCRGSPFASGLPHFNRCRGSPFAFGLLHFMPNGDLSEEAALGSACTCKQGDLLLLRTRRAPSWHSGNHSLDGRGHAPPIP